MPTNSRNGRGALLIKVARDQADRIAEEPGDDRGGQEKSHGPWDGVRQHRRYRERKVVVGRAEVEVDHHPFQIGQILLEDAAFQAVELFQILPKFRDFCRVQRGAGTALQLADVRVDRVDRHQARQREGYRETDEQDGEILQDPFGDETGSIHVDPPRSAEERTTGSFRSDFPSGTRRPELPRPERNHIITSG